jgi:hypothetical protein
MDYRGGRIPYGFALNRSHTQLVPDIHEQNALKMARALKQRGLSLRAIGETLTQMGFRARTGWWHPTQVSRLLGANAWRP